MVIILRSRFDLSEFSFVALNFVGVIRVWKCETATIGRVSISIDPSIDGPTEWKAIGYHRLSNFNIHLC
jgi:hypothetical protein